MNNEPNRGRALVIGGSMAGMLAARVLSEHYDEVLIMDKDDFPEKPEHRPGTPQAYHPHRLLPRGKLILETCFPAGWTICWRKGLFLKRASASGPSVFTEPSK